MKQQIKDIILKAATKAFENGDLPSSDFPEFVVEEPKIEAHGDFSTNIAMVMAKIQKMAPRKIAEAIINRLGDTNGAVAKTEIAGPGFINFFMDTTFWHPVLSQVHKEDIAYGKSVIGQGKKVMVEFVSANPTGPLHVGHGRGAAVGDSVARILAFNGYDVKKEYYINDSGRQIRTLGTSVFLRYRSLFGDDVEFPEDCYQGEYIIDMARAIKADRGRELIEITEEEAIAYCARLAADSILDGIRSDLESFGITFDNWFSEQSLFDNGMVDKALKAFQEKGTIYEEDGAKWFRTTDYGDEKDRVVVRNNGLTTYFASDIAYHQEKFERGFERLIDVWGADHHGYIPRMTASVMASGHKKEQFDVVLVQLVNLLRGGEPVAMSTRSGEFETLQDVVNEVGKDAARFIFLTRNYESPLDFDLDIAKKKSNDNPVYYVQYVHARISSILEKGRERGIIDVAKDKAAIARLIEPEEVHLMKALARYPETVIMAAETMAPHRITFYLMELASCFHTYYNKHRVLVEDDKELMTGRLFMILAIKNVIRNGLSLLGVSAPEKM
ncbi:MAG: arginine--tRNA ligase [Desulfobacterales bacterium]|nr:arginine--tRNA ligase [Desulfobacterales bacterium]